MFPLRTRIFKFIIFQYQDSGKLENNNIINGTMEQQQQQSQK